VQVEQGTLTGLEAGGVDEFLGVRYAQPPVGALRWQPPVPVPASHAAVKATEIGANCAQNPSPWGTPSTAEDCLFLNVYVPASAQHRHGFGQALPVMLWIHGGGFIAGQGSVYDPSPLVKRGDVIVVTINHRLGALGLLAHPALDREHHLIANYALMDQEMALKWVSQNIRAFGGDPRNVTLFGESSGGIAIYSHLASPLSSGLFQKAIIESGAPDYITLDVAEATGLTLAQKVGCTTGTPQQIAACLRQVPVSALLANQSIPTGAIIDGRLLPEPPATAIAEGRFNHVALINGTNHYEGRLIAAFLFDLSGAPLQASGYASALGIISNFLPGTGYPLSAIPAIMQAYPLTAYPSPDLAAAAVITDGTIVCPAYEMDKLFSRSVPLWAYQLTDDNAPEIVAPPVSFPYGATHFSELQYLFDMAALTLPGTPPLSPAQERLSGDMIGYWTAFARASDPNFSSGAAYWRNFEHRAEGPMQALTTPSPQAETDFASMHKCAFWRALRASFQ
jgi:para-nitrobenzyl esterase